MEGKNPRGGVDNGRNGGRTRYENYEVVEERFDNGSSDKWAGQFSDRGEKYTKNK